MTRNTAPIVRLDSGNLRERLRQAAARLDSEKFDEREMEHLVAVVTRCSAIIEDVYTDDRLRSILGDDPRHLAALLAVPWIGPQAADRDSSSGLLLRLRRLPDRVREVGDQALFDVALTGRSAIHGVSLEALGPRAYTLAAEVLELFAADARLREHFVRGDLARSSRIEDEVRFLRGCAERFDLYSRMLRLAGDQPDGHGARDARSTLFVPAVRPDGAVVRFDQQAAASEREEREAPRRAPESRPSALFGDAAYGRGHLLAAYERLLLFSCLDLEALRTELQERVIDQSEAIEALLDDFALYAVGTQSLVRPGSYFLVGPTGVGKNHLVETLVDRLQRQWGIEVPLLTIEGPNYTYPSDINELRGATRGFIRSDEPGLLTEFHKRSSESALSVILVDEVEKSHAQLRRFFLAIMDRGVTTDAHGNELSFAGTLIFFTSNIGYREASAAGRPIGFGGDERADEAEQSELSRSLRRVLSPEFLNRVKLLRFGHLPRSSAVRIVNLEFRKIAQRYRELHGIEVSLTDAGRDALLEEGYSREFGARHLAAVLHRVCNVGVGKLIRGDERDGRRDTARLLERVRELRESGSDVDLSRLDGEVLAEARARVPYRRVVVDAEDDGRVVYRRES